jgi:regulator of RNase E activity RraA
MATIFTRLGAVGLVSDCAVRDLPEVRAMGFQYFARGAVVSHGWFRIVRSGVPVHVGCGEHPAAEGGGGASARREADGLG